jgi:hypothetical protein
MAQRRNPLMPPPEAMGMPQQPQTRQPQQAQPPQPPMGMPQGQPSNTFQPLPSPPASALTMAQDESGDTMTDPIAKLLKMLQGA